MSEVEISREKYATEISAETRFVRDSSLFSISLVLVGIFGLIRSFYIAKFLGPQGFGTWRFVRIFEQYVHLASLGTGPAMHRKIPFLRGKGDLKGLRNVLSITWAINFYTSILYSAVVFAISFFVAETSSARALAAFSPVTFLLAWRLYAFTFLMDTGLYGLRSRLEIVYAASTMLFSLALVTIWGVYGAIAGWGVSALIIVFISTRKLWQYLSFRIDWRNLWDLMVTGFPVMADTMLPITMHNADRIMIAAMLSRELLGIYSVGFAGVAILIMIPSALGQMLFVKFAELDGQNRTKEHISNVLDRTTLVLSSLFAPILCVVIALFPIAVAILLPEYIGGIAAGKLLITGVFFVCVSLPVTKWCVSTGRFMSVLVLRVVVVAAEFVALYLVIKSGARLELIALCVLSAFAVFSIAMVIVGNHLLEKPFRRGLVCVGKSVSPLLSVLAAIWIQDFAYPIGAYVPGSRLFLSCTLGLIVSLAVSTPFVYLANRQTRLAQVIFKTT